MGQYQRAKCRESKASNFHKVKVSAELMYSESMWSRVKLRIKIQSIQKRRFKKDPIFSKVTNKKHFLKAKTHQSTSA